MFWADSEKISKGNTDPERKSPIITINKNGKAQPTSGAQKENMLIKKTIAKNKNTAITREIKNNKRYIGFDWKNNSGFKIKNNKILSTKEKLKLRILLATSAVNQYLKKFIGFSKYNAKVPSEIILESSIVRDEKTIAFITKIPKT